MADKITAAELKSQKNNFVIIDVREIDELEGGKIDDSTHMPLGLTIRNAKKNRLRISGTKKSALIVEQVIGEILQQMSYSKRDLMQLLLMVDILPGINLKFFIHSILVVFLAMRSNLYTIYFFAYSTLQFQD